MTLEESREIIPLMESMIGQIEEQQTLMAVSYTHLDVYKRQFPWYRAHIPRHDRSAALH